jgi:carbamoyl-phosphate synthase large subunit
MDSSVGDFRELHKRAMQLRIPCMTSLDTASAYADIIAARYDQRNTRLIDINAGTPGERDLSRARSHKAGSEPCSIFCSRRR